ncbi:hypothetical protein [Amnibacterium kyonggiense]|uniref:hypothetical protein n=1 Tax=Amnibacterium kyonggiense TaxID=595671 RepID=UPI0031DA5ABC
MPAHAPTEELRLRLYRPDPPDGALEAYLLAMADSPAPAAATRRERASARPGVTALAAALGLGGVAPLVAAALAAGSVAGDQTGETASTGPTTVALGPSGRVPLPPSTGVPLGTLFDDAGSTARFDAAGRTAVISVNCVGDGTLSVRVADEPPTVLTCQIGGPALAMLPSTTPLHRFAVAVTRDGRVRWSLAAGTLPGA